MTKWVIVVSLCIVAALIAFGAIQTARVEVLRNRLHEDSISWTNTNEKLRNEIESQQGIIEKQNEILSDVKKAQTLRDYINISKQINEWIEGAK